MQIKLLHLYYDIMNLYGEYGNIKILEKHLKDQGFEVIVDKKTIGDIKNLGQYDFVYIGCGTERNQKAILEDIKIEKEELKKIIEDGKVVLLTGNSFEILGKSIDGKQALEILDFETEILKDRITTDIICKTDMLESKVVGFVNTMSKVKNNENPLFKIEWKAENIIKDEEEGIVYKNLIGTHLIGPILVRNPEMLKVIIEKICMQKDEKFKYKEINYQDEQKGYKLVLKELDDREKNI